jgi:GNAT superfamily N-acetyltransferase
MKHLLDNIAWHTLNAAHAEFSVGTHEVRRYAPGFSPIFAFADPQAPNFDALVPFCTAGEHLYCDGWTGPAPSGWCIESQTTMFKLIWEGAQPPADDTLEAVRLGPEHAAQALELATLTRPGPFGLRTIELGEYFGCFAGPRLVAMAGERMQAAKFREISGVCTQPEFQGQGLARRLVNLLIRRQMQRGEVPFLHVMRDNENAHRLYERMGFRDYRESVVRVVAQC